MAEETTSQAPAGRSRVLLIAVIVLSALLIAGVAGATTWYFARSNAGQNADVAGNGDGTAARQRRSGKSGLFVSLDQFVVNLNDTDADRYAQIAMVLEVDDASAESQLKAQMPAVRNAILLLISARSAGELLSLAGKQRLAIDVALATRAVLKHERPPAPGAASGPDGASTEAAPVEFSQADTSPIAAVHFAQFIVQ